MNLEGVEKTMLLTLFAKAKHSQQKNHKFYDSKAIEVICKHCIRNGYTIQQVG